MHSLEADYLVVGAGAMGMAFIDTLVSETPASVVLVDRNHQPGGHWTTAYPFVRLHQPSAFYGVNSLSLGRDTIDQVGYNVGLYVIVGAGKTGIDTCLWLLGQGVAPDRLTWIMPRDSWLLDRATIQPGSVFADRVKGVFTAQLQAIRDAVSVDDLFARLEDAG